MLDPKLGRFLQTDPIGYAGGLNLYAYVGNDPVNLIDPLGMLDCGLESNWRSGNCADRAVEYQLRQLNPDLSEAALNFATSQILDYFHGGISFGQLQFNLAEWDAFHFASGTGLSGDLSRAQQIARQEFDRTARLAPPGAGHNDIYDAERHARWVYRMADEIGPLTALSVSDLHEYQNLLQGSPWREIYMDLHNNRVGYDAWRTGGGIPSINTPGLMYLEQTGVGGTVYVYRCC